MLEAVIPFTPRWNSWIKSTRYEGERLAKSGQKAASLLAKLKTVWISGEQLIADLLLI